MKQYKLIGCDLDGTLFNDRMSLSPENERAIRLLSDKGVYIVPVTGRAFSEMEELADNPYIRYIITSNGAVILDKKTGESIYLCLSSKTARFVWDTLKKYDYFTIVHYKGKTYIKDINDDEIKSYNISSDALKIMNGYANRVAEFEEKTRLMENIESIVVFFKNDNEKEACKKILSNDERLYVAEVRERSIEIFSAAAGKEKAMKKLAEKLGISPQEIICIGDSGNDVEMTKFAGLGLSVSNGCEELKSVADEVICSNNEHIAKYVLNKYFS